MSPEENKALVRRFYEEIDKGNIDILDELVAVNYIDHSPPPFPGLAPGRAGVKQAFRLFEKGTPGYHKIEEQVAEGDKVVTRLTSYGKHEGDLPGAPRTGNEMKMTSITIHRIEDGRLAEKWSEKDSIGLLTQLGVMRPPGIMMRRWKGVQVAAFAALLIALITVSFQSIKAASANPVKSLRTE